MLVDFCLNDTLEFNYSGSLMVSYCKLKHLKKRKAHQPNASFILGSSTDESLFLVISCDLSLKNTF